MLSFGESIQAGYVDRIYRNAALGDRNLIGHSSLLVLVLLLTFIPISFLVPKVARHHTVISKLSYVLISLVSLVSSFFLLIIVSLSMGVMEINASFNQRLAVMAPAINDQEYKEFRAQWARMRSQSDYRALVSTMEKRASDLQIQLPELRKP